MLGAWEFISGLSLRLSKILGAWDLGFVRQTSKDAMVDRRHEHIGRHSGVLLT